MLRILIIILLTASSALANNETYWAVDIPVMQGATNVSVERNEKFYTVSTSYELMISDPEKIYDFYNEFFKKIGWENPMKKFPRQKNEIQSKWSSFQSKFNQNGLPESYYGSMWEAQTIPAIGAVNLTLTSYDGEKFKTKVKVSLSPDIDTSSLFQLQSLMTGDPRNIFILHEATGGNPFEIDKINPTPSSEHKNNKMVMEYYSLVEQIFMQYQDFGTKYIHK